MGVRAKTLAFGRNQNRGASLCLFPAKFFKVDQTVLVPRSKSFYGVKRRSLDGEVFPLFHLPWSDGDPDGLDVGQGLASLPGERVLLLKVRCYKTFYVCTSLMFVLS
jgi:hypothetical protein